MIRGCWEVHERSQKYAFEAAWRQNKLMLLIQINSTYFPFNLRHFYCNGNSNPIHKLINLKILNWLVKYCQKWTNSNALKWDVWDSGYSLRSSSWYASNSNSSDSENSIQ